MMQTNIIINYNLQFSIYDFAFVIRSLGSRQCRHILQMESSEFLHLLIWNDFSEIKPRDL